MSLEKNMDDKFVERLVAALEQLADGIRQVNDFLAQLKVQGSPKKIKIEAEYHNEQH